MLSRSFRRPTLYVSRAWYASRRGVHYYSTTTATIQDKRQQALDGGGRDKRDAQHAKVDNGGHCANGCC